jgi:outer membrane lipoprotein-sorting protein
MINSRVACLALVVTITSACSAPWSPPTAAEILNKPAQSDMKDGHFTVKAHVTSGTITVDLTGDGTLVLKPKYAVRFNLQGSVGQLPIGFQEIVVDGQSYSRLGNQKWIESPSQSEPGNIGSSAKNPRMVGEDNLSQGKSWHEEATDSTGQAFDVWVRESDGYLVKYSGSLSTGSITLEFDKYNTGGAVSAPPASDVQPPAKTLTAQVGDPMALNGVRVTVVSADLNAKSGNEFITAKAGNRFVAVQVLYENTGTDAYNYNPFDWKLTDSAGFSYDSSFGGIGPELNAGTIQPGEKARGYITYEVPTTAAGLQLRLTSGGDTATVALN